MTNLPRPCLDCGKLTKNTRCETCRLAQVRVWDAQRDPAKRKHYTGTYQREAKRVREAGIACHWCGGPFTPDNPVQADHVDAGNPNSVLVASCRRCNIRRARGS
jgi:hypothetical protein